MSEDRLQIGNRKEEMYTIDKPITAAQAQASIEAHPITGEELDVFEALAAQGVPARPEDYLRLVAALREVESE